MHDRLAHAAEHAFIGSLQKLLGQTLRVRKVEHKGSGNTAFIVIPQLDIDTVIKAESEVNSLIAEGRKISVRTFASLEEARRQISNLRANEERIAGEVRVVEIENHDVAACAMDHASNLQECDFFLVTRLSKSGSEYEVDFVVGRQAKETAVALSARLLKVCGELGANINTVENTARKLRSENEGNTRKLRALGREKLSGIRPVTNGRITLLKGIFENLADDQLQVGLVSQHLGGAAAAGAEITVVCPFDRDFAGQSPAPIHRTGRVLSYGKGTTYWPMGEVLKQHFGIAEGDSAETIGARLADYPYLGLTLGIAGEEELHPLVARERLHDAWVAGRRGLGVHEDRERQAHGLALLLGSDADRQQLGHILARQLGQAHRVEHLGDRGLDLLDGLAEAAPLHLGAVAVLQAAHDVDRTLQGPDHLAHGDLGRTPREAVAPLGAVLAHDQPLLGQALKDLRQQLGRDRRVLGDPLGAHGPEVVVDGDIMNRHQPVIGALGEPEHVLPCASVMEPVYPTVFVGDSSGRSLPPGVPAVNGKDHHD